MYRVGRAGTPWDLADWKYGPFNGRFDDPDAAYRVRYVALTRASVPVESQLDHARQIGGFFDRKPHQLLTIGRRNDHTPLADLYKRQLADFPALSVLQIRVAYEGHMNTWCQG